MTVKTYLSTKLVCQLDINGYYAGQTAADLSPLEAAQGVYLLPAFTVDAEPPAQKDGYAVFWDAANAAWDYRPDYRGQTVYSTATGDAVRIDMPGDYPAGTTKQPRPSSYHTFDDTKSGWVLTDAAAAQQQADAAQALRGKATAELNYATVMIASLQDEIDLSDGGDTATATALLAEWRKYRVACLKVQRGEQSELPARPGDKAQ